MKKLILCVAMAMSLLPLQAKVGYLLTTGSISDLPAENYNGVNQQPEKNAASWFETEYINKGEGSFISLSQIKSGIDVATYPVLWINVDRVGLANLAAAGVDNNVINAVKNYVKNGGRLYLTKQAVTLAYNIGRMGYAPSWASGGYTKGGDIWTINAQIGIWPGISQTFDRRTHMAYSGLQTTSTVNSYKYNGTTSYYQTYPMIGADARTDNNNFWVDMYRKSSSGGKQEQVGSEDDQTNPSNTTHYNNGMVQRLTEFESDWNCKVLAVWGQVTDFCAPGLIEFTPTASYPGTVITNGFAAYQWGSGNSKLANVKKLTKNILSYLSGEQPEPEPEPEPEKPGTKVKIDMTIDNGVIKEKISNTAVNLNSLHTPVNLNGARGKALRTDGYSTYISLPINNKGLSTEQLTFSVWCAVQTYPMMVLDVAGNEWSSIAGNIDDNARTGFAFRLSSQGDFRFECYSDGNKYTVNSTSKLPVNKWNHLVATIDTKNASLALYNNGTKLGSTGMGSVINIGNSELLIGKSKIDKWSYNCMLNAFNGLIDDVQIDNGIWSSADIKGANPEYAVNFNIPKVYWEGDLLKPMFHGQPNTNWTNESHGLIYSNGKYHVFFQKNGNGPYMSRLHWGHISSTNLMEWEEEYIALYPLNGYDMKGCWSGCVFTDAEITGGKPWIIYTGVDNGHASMNLAYSKDETLIEWTKPTKNPIVSGVPSGYDSDFRDSYFFRNGNYGYLIVGCGKGGVGTTALFRHSNGSWQHQGQFFTGNNSSESGTFFEMPNVTPMGNGKWIFTATPLGGGNGVRTVYWVGTIDNDGRFHPYSASPKCVELPGMAREGYGLLSPSIYNKDGRTLALGIVPDKISTETNVDMGWAHLYCLPREWSLNSNNELVQKPAAEVAQLRSNSSKYSRNSFNLDGSQSLNPVNGRQVEVKASFRVGTSEFGVKLLNDLKVYYTPNSNELTIDLTGVNRRVNDGGVFNGIYRSVLPKNISQGSTLKMDIFLDHSILDVFINDTWATSVRVFPTNYSQTGASIYSNGSTFVESVEAWVLNVNMEPTSIEETAEPVENFVPVFYSNGYIFYDFEEESSMMIYDSVGKPIFYEEGLNGKNVIPFSYKGLFFIRVNNTDTYKQIAI